MTETQSPALRAVADLGLTVTSEFVPFSKSRHAKPSKRDGKPWRSLNWVVTLHRNGKPVLTTEYSAGEAHCPSYKSNIKPTVMRKYAIDFEIENGYQAELAYGETYMAIKSKPILPSPLDVISSLVLDSEALDYPTYKDWADNFGYDPDSRDDERVYRQCLKYALKLRAAIGESGLAQLRTAFQDY